MEAVSISRKPKSRPHAAMMVTKVWVPSSEGADWKVTKKTLKEKMDKFNLNNAIKNNKPWLEIIVGAGRHSKKNEQNIRPKVEKLLVTERNHTIFNILYVHESH